MTTHPRISEEGFSPEDVDGDLILDVDGVEVRESTWAGAYYCAHVLYMTTRYARATQTSIARDAHGDPLVGFIHVPADAETAGEGAPTRSRRERHARTARILACALAGVVDELDVARAGADDKARVLLTGFGPFAAVVSNPTGDFVDHEESVAHALSTSLGKPAVAGVGDDVGIRCHSAGHVVLGRILLDVHDSALDPRRPGSLPWAIERFQPHAVIGLGVHRASSIYRVELEPTNAGLVADLDHPRHERGRPIDNRGAHNRALARAIARGAAKLA